LILSNIFRDNDYEDEECFEETKGDIMRLVSTFGTIQLLDVKLLGDEKGEVHIKYLEGDLIIDDETYFCGTSMNPKNYPIWASRKK
jgi:hypothetical protein